MCLSVVFFACLCVVACFLDSLVVRLVGGLLACPNDYMFDVGVCSCVCLCLAV